jgi:hypothetical protein
LEGENETFSTVKSWKRMEKKGETYKGLERKWNKYKKRDKRKIKNLSIS